MKYIQLILSFGFLSVIYTSCAPTIEKKEDAPLFADYYFRYLASDKQFRAEATFFEKNDKKKKPITMATVSFNGQVMKARNLQKMGTRYRIDKINQAAPNLLDFECINFEEHKRSFQTNLASLSNIKLDFPIHKSKGFLVKWDGSPLTDNEEIVFLFTDQNNNGFTEVIKGPTSEAAIEFPVSKTNQFEIGSGLLTLVRKSRQINTTDGLTVDITTEFYANSVPIEIEE